MPSVTATLYLPGFSSAPTKTGVPHTTTGLHGPVQHSSFSLDTSLFQKEQGPPGVSWPTQLNKHSQKDPAEERQKVLQAAVGTGVHCRVVNCFCLLAAFLQTLGSFTVRRGLTATVVAIGARRRGMCSVARSGSGAINPDTESLSCRWFRSLRGPQCWPLNKARNGRAGVPAGRERPLSPAERKQKQDRERPPKT